MADEQKTPSSPPPPPPPKQDVKNTPVLQAIMEGATEGGRYSRMATDSKPVSGKGDK